MLLQLAGHLRGRALQEWNLLEDADKQTVEGAKKALKAGLDMGGILFAAQDFHHTIQKAGEPVADFIRELEKLF